MSIQPIESAEWKNYNANTRDARVGDCVKRALTIAYSMDYDEVGKELNRIKRKKGMSAYNFTSVYYEFCKQRGNYFEKMKWDDLVDTDTGELTGEEGAPIRVSQVCDTLHTGTYLLEVGEKPDGHSSHLCVVVDGILFDSWDSRRWFVKKWSVVTRDTTEVYQMDYEEISDEIDEYLISYLAKLQKKNDDLLSSADLTPIERVNRYTYELTVIIRFKEYPPHASNYDRSKSWGHTITIKLNPRLTPENNAAILKKKIAQKIYDWSYNVLKDVRDAMAVEQFDWSESKLGKFSYTEDKKIVMNLPEWCRKRIRYISYDPNLSWQSSKYELTMEALPDDPNIASRGESVYFYADTFRELKHQLEYYKEDYSRFNYEY